MNAATDHTSKGTWMPKKSKGMSAEHKAALAKGRAQSKAVRDYLEMLEQDGRRSSNVSPDQVDAKIHELTTRIEAESNPAARLELVQKRLDLEEQLKSAGEGPDPEAVEKAFVEAAREYGERKGISYTAWREVGVPAATLREAGVSRTRRTA